MKDMFFLQNQEVHLGGKVKLKLLKDTIYD